MAGGGGGGPQETALDKELASIGVERYSRYKERFAPVEDYSIKQVTEGREGGAERAQGVSAANYEQQFGLAEPALAMGLGGRSAGTLSSGAGKLGIAQGAVDKGTARGLGAVDTGLGSERTYFGNLQSLINIGQGKSDQALTGLNRAAQASQNQAIIDARASAAARNALLGAVGTGVGTYYGSLGPSTGSGLSPAMRTDGYVAPVGGYVRPNAQTFGST